MSCLVLTVDQAPKKNFGTRVGTLLQEYFITVSSQLNRKKSIIGLKIVLKVPFFSPRNNKVLRSIRGNEVNISSGSLTVISYK